MQRAFMVACVTLFMCVNAAPAAEQAAARPNVVILYADDLGYGDVRCYNPDRGKIPTPNIDRLASQGIRFTDAHSSSAVCSPSRYTLLTGRYHWRTRLQSGIVGKWGRPLIAPDRLTLPEMLRQSGYRTACIGKWHLGWEWHIAAEDRPFLLPKLPRDAVASAEHRAAWRRVFSQPIGGGPTAHGFQRYFGTDVPNWPPFSFIEDDRTVGIPSEFLPPRLFTKNMASVQGPALENWTLESILPELTDRAVRFIRNASSDSQQPYFLYMPLTSPHTPLAVNEPWQGKSGLNSYADFVMETDATVGRVLAAIDRSGTADRTIVLFSSDNGCAPYIGVDELEKKGHFPSGPLRGYKSDAWEGGHRVPLIVRWPGVVRPGRVCGRLVHQADVMATITEVIGKPLPANAGEDSFSLLPLASGEDRDVRETSVSQSINGLLAVRRGPWKLLFGRGSGGWTNGEDAQPAQLYNLDDDLSETRNLYADRPDVVAELNELMERLVRDGRSTPGPAQANDVPVRWKPME